MSFTFRPIITGETFHRIYQGKKFVGRVYRNAITGQWHGRIGQHEVEAGTALQAFQEVGSRALGHSSHAALRQANIQVRRQRTQARQAVRSALDQAYAGNFDPFMDLLQKI